MSRHDCHVDNPPYGTDADGGFCMVCGHRYTESTLPKGDPAWTSDTTEPQYPVTELLMNPADERVGGSLAPPTTEQEPTPNTEDTTQTNADKPVRRRRKAIKRPRSNDTRQASKQATGTKTGRIQGTEPRTGKQRKTKLDELPELKPIGEAWNNPQ